MQLIVEFDSEYAAERAHQELNDAGFDDEAVQVTHPFDGGTVVSVRTAGEGLVKAFEVLKRHEAESVERVMPTSNTLI
jgi:hypothetical protein